MPRDDGLPMGQEIQDMLQDGLTWPEIAAHTGADQERLKKKWTNWSAYMRKGGKQL